MYAIYADEKLIYAPGLDDEGYSITKPKLIVEDNRSGSLTFVLPPSNLMYDNIYKLKTIITVFRDKKEIFRGRVLYDKKDFYNRKNIFCEGELSFLVDSILRPFSFQGTLAELFSYYIENHNQQVDSYKQFIVGNITVYASGVIDITNAEYGNTWKSINKLISTYGGHIRTRLENDVRYIDYIADYGKESTQTIEFGKNLLDLSEHITAKDVFTVLIPTGATAKDADTDEDCIVDIKSVNNGLDYIYSDVGMYSFGRIWKNVNFKDITEPAELLEKATAYLEKAIELSTTITINAIDLSVLSVDIESICIGDLLQVISSPHKLDTSMMVSRIEINLAQPGQSKITVGSIIKSSSDRTVNYYTELEKLHKQLGIT